MLEEVEGLLHFPLVYWISFRNRNKLMLPFFQEEKQPLSKNFLVPPLMPQFSATPISAIFPGTFLFEVNNRQSRFYANCDQLITFLMFHANSRRKLELTFNYLPETDAQLLVKNPGVIKFPFFFLLVNSFLQITKLFTTLRVNEQAFWDLKTALTMAIVGSLILN